jgi:tRNA(Ile)-lysidine synthase
MLKHSSLQKLQNKKNLLAFSAGVDSTALLFLLLQNTIQFDIAIVDYGIRVQSKEEVAYAQELAKTYHFKCHLHNAAQIEKSFEAKAREIRYDFFHALIHEQHYENLLTAHHLGDRFEWMLMQFCKGAGCAEMAGMKEEEQRENYTLLRPLLHLDKSELLEYLHTNAVKYFIDESNSDESIKRNEFRHNITLPLLHEHLLGIKKSFAYIDEDVASLIQNTQLTLLGEFAFFTSTKDKRSDIYAIDKHLKTQGYMPSAGERELLKLNAAVVLGRKFLVSTHGDFVFISPYKRSERVLPKEFKEECRKLKIDPKLRIYLYENSTVFGKLKELLAGV